MRLKRTSTLCTLLIGVFFVGSIGTASAVVLRPISDDELLARATHISVSEVVNITSFWRGQRILSWIELQPIRSFRGATTPVRLLVPGGTVAHLTQVVPGASKFQLGMQSLYFLEPLPSGDGFRLVGFNHGVVHRAQGHLFERLISLVSSATPLGRPSELERTR